MVSFKVFSTCKTCDPLGGAIFGPMGIIRTILAEFYYLMLHTKYQSSRTNGFRQEDFSIFFHIFSLC